MTIQSHMRKKKYIWPDKQLSDLHRDLLIIVRHKNKKTQTSIAKTIC